MITHLDLFAFLLACFFFNLWGFLGGVRYGEGCSHCLFIISTTGFYTCKLISNVFYQTIVDVRNWPVQ